MGYLCVPSVSTQHTKGEVLLPKPGCNWQLPSTDKSPQTQNGISVFLCVHACTA